ncbi:MAG: ATP-binding protein [Bacteroidota bacterium]
MIEFAPFNPLAVKISSSNDAATRAVKREIRNILGSYVGWFDPFAESLQNSLDSVEERALQEDADYRPTIRITIDIKENSFTVTDNGLGLDKTQFESFLAPDFSFKSGKARGQKGVGATYLAYGFNFIQVATKSPYFSAVGRMINARDWVQSDNPAGDPQIEPDEGGVVDRSFDSIGRGVSICIKFGKNTYPKDLGWIKAHTADAWLRILLVKTGLGAIDANPELQVFVDVIDGLGNRTSANTRGIEYYRPHKAAGKCASIGDIKAKKDELYKREKDPNILPPHLTNLEVIYGNWGHEQLRDILTLSDEEREACEKYQPQIFGDYVYSTKFWDRFNETLGVRANIRILYGGIQIAANNMPQGELIQIPLKRNIGRQNNAHFLIHFRNCSPDLGRKGYQNEIVSLAATISSRLVDVMSRYHECLKASTGASADIIREEGVEQWKEEMARYEGQNPLSLINENFFLPMKCVPITSQPTREQDVIALFNQLLAGGVIRGIKIMSTNERFTYDGLFRITITEPVKNHAYEKSSNPLGILQDIIKEHKELPFESRPRILEYKYSLDGLIEDIESGLKNSNEIGLVVVWETGEEWRGNYKITSLMDENNLHLRQYHGITHVLTDLTTGQREMDLVVLKELIAFLNDPNQTLAGQREKYGED